MNRVWLAALLGVTVGVADVLLMLSLQFQDRTAALLGAFCSRFALGFFAATARLPLPPVWAGIVVGLLTSMPDAIITKTSRRFSARGFFSARSVVGRSDGGALRLHDIAKVMHGVRETSTPPQTTSVLQWLTHGPMQSGEANAGSQQADSRLARPRTALNEDRDCDRTVIRRAQNLEEHRGLRTHTE